MTETAQERLFCWQLTYRDANLEWQREVLTSGKDEADRRAHVVNALRDDDGNYVNRNVSLQRRPTVEHGCALLLRALGDPKANGHVDMHVDEMLELLIDAGWQAPGA